jgi:polyisoprenoid-binding protein YceI
MNFKRSFLCLALFTALSLSAAEMTKYEPRPGGKVTIDGDSTVHKWTVQSQIIQGTMELGFDPQNPPAPGKVQAKVATTIPVRSVRSDKKAMTDIMHETLKIQTAPKIEYRLTELTLKEAPKSPTAPLLFDSKGELAVAGVTNQITMPVTMERLEGNKLKTSGSVNLKMTSFGMKPPAPKIALGLISTSDDVKVTFDWLTEKAGPATASAK